MKWIKYRIVWNYQEGDTKFYEELYTAAEKALNKFRISTKTFPIMISNRVWCITYMGREADRTVIKEMCGPISKKHNINIYLLETYVNANKIEVV